MRSTPTAARSAPEAALERLPAGSPSQSPPSNLGRRFPAEVLTPDEVRRLIKAASGRAPTGIRNRALIAVLYRGGLRVAEALSLFPKDLDRESGTVRILRGKGGKARTVALDPEAFALVERWLDRRAQLTSADGRALNGRHPVFSTLDGGLLKTAYVRTLLPRLARRAGIDKRVHAHGLRHSFASGLAMEGVPMPIIQAALGHSSLATTSRYLAHIAPEQVIATLRARTWTVDGPAGR